eukprot:3968035-Prymnesium_polylepis.2
MVRLPARTGTTCSICLIFQTYHAHLLPNPAPPARVVVRFGLATRQETADAARSARVAVFDEQQGFKPWPARLRAAPLVSDGSLSAHPARRLFLRLRRPHSLAAVG